jgi:hypothetical protein
VLSRIGWSFFVRFDPRGKHAKYIFLEEDVCEEDEEDVG